MKKLIFISIVFFSYFSLGWLYANDGTNPTPLRFDAFVNGFKDSPDMHQEVLYLFVRHAYAPGVGDPENFTIGDCRTQRNLNNEGIVQAQALGKRYQDAGIFSENVYSSQWCRCLETAKNFGKTITVVENPGLNSFFQGLVDRQSTLDNLNRFFQENPTPALASLEHTNSNIRYIPITVLVTHQVVIRAVTGISVSSGGMVLYNPRSRSAQEIIN